MKSFSRNLFSGTCLSLALAGCFSVLTTEAHAEGMDKVVEQSALVWNEFQGGVVPLIPKAVVKNAKGIVIMKVTKGGLIFSGKSGSGVLVARKPDGQWSGPVGLSTSGAGFGLQAGGSVTELVLILNSDAAVQRFARDTKVKFSGNMKAVAGPDRVEESETFTPTVPVYAYKREDGAFAGISIDGSVFAVESEWNQRYYGRAVTANQIITGKVIPPAHASKLLKILPPATVK